MSDYLIQRLRVTANLDVRLNTEVVDCVGARRLRGLVLADRSSGMQETVAAAALFVEIGGEPHTDWLPESVARDKRGYVLTGSALGAGTDAAMWRLDRPPLPLETSLPGVFAPGDVRSGTSKRVAPAVGEGAIAIRSVHEYLNQQEAAGRSRADLVGAAATGSP